MVIGFLFFFALNLFFFNYEQVTDSQMNLKEQGGIYKEYIREYRTMETEKAIKELDEKYNSNIKGKTERENAASMGRVAIFADKKSFSCRNIQKTVGDFKFMKGMELNLTSQRVVTSVMENSYTGYLMLAVIVMTILFFLQEKKRDLWEMVYASARGRGGVMADRITLIGILSAVTVILFYLLKVLISAAIWGVPGIMDAPIQTVAMFQKLTMNVTVMEFFILYGLLQFIGLFAVGLFVMSIITICRNKNAAVFILSVIIIGEFLLYRGIPENSKQIFLKIANIYAVVDWKYALENYLNLNVMWGLVERRPLMTVAVAVILILSVMFLSYIGGRQSLPGEAGLQWRGFEAMKKYREKIRLYEGLFLKERNKLLFKQKGIIFILLLIYLAFFQTQLPFVGLGEAQQVKDSYFGQWEGILTEEKDNEITAQHRKIESRLKEKEKEIQERPTQVKQEEARFLAVNLSVLEEIRTQIQILEEKKKRGEIKEVWLVNRNTYTALLDVHSYRWCFLEGMGAVFLLILTGSGIYAYEKKGKMRFLLKATARGRAELFRRKSAVMLVLSFVINTLLFSSQLLLVSKEWTLGNTIQAPIACMETYLGTNWGLPIWGVLLILFLWRGAVLAAVSGMISLISVFAGQELSTVLISVSVLLVPSLLYDTGTEWMGRFSLPSMYGGIEKLAEAGNSVWGCIPMAVGVIAAGAICYCLCGKVWIGKNHSRGKSC